MREVILWLGQAFRGGSPLLIHGFLDRKSANRELKHKGLGAFLLRFSERQPDKLVIVFNEQNEHPATHCLVELIDLRTSQSFGRGSSNIHESNKCCISFEGGASQEYATLGDLVLDCRRLSHSQNGTAKTDLFKNSKQHLLPEPLQGVDPLQ